MKELVKVKLADVYPLEDEYGNNFASRDYTTPENKAYVKELAESMRAKGVPDEEIQLVRDGQIYRIKAGNSRVMAMRELGTKECYAVVDDEDTVQSVLETVVRTDVKKRYEPVELSRFVRQLQLFGDDKYVSEVSRIDRGKLSRVRRSAQAVGDAADDMTLDRLEAIEEFIDDPDAVGELSNCKESEWRWKADALRRKRRARESSAELKAKVEELVDAGAITVFEDYAAAVEAGYQNQWLSVQTAGQLDGLMAKYPESAYYAKEDYAGTWILGMVRPSDEASDGVSPEDAEWAEKMSETCKEVLDDADAWYGNIVSTGNAAKCGAVSERCAAAFKEGVNIDYEVTWESLDNDDSPFARACEFPLSAVDYALGWYEWAPSDELSARQFLAIRGASQDYGAARFALEMLDFLEALAESGWKGSAGAMELWRILEEYRGEGDEE